jgi:hypothetical protein
MLAGTSAALGPAVVTAPGALLSVLAGVGGLAGTVLFIVLDGATWAGWLAFAMSVVGVLGATLALPSLLDGPNVTGSVIEEIAASVVGLQLPLYGTAVFVSLLVALKVDTVVT